jgi:hypothetical protein
MNLGFDNNLYEYNAVCYYAVQMLREFPTIKNTNTLYTKIFKVKIV